MDLSLSEQQRLMLDTARAWLRERWRPVAGDWIDGDLEIPRSLWDDVAGLGWLQLSVSERCGGLGGGMLDLVLLHEALGEALFPSALSTTLLVARLIDRACDGRGPLHERHAHLLAGSEIATIATQEGDGTFLAGPVTTGLVHTAGTPRLTGEKWFVRHAAAAGCLAVRAPVDEPAGRGASSWLLVEHDAPGVTITPQASSGHDRQCRVRFDDVPVDAHGLIHDSDGRLASEAMLLEAAYLVGLATETHSLTVRHAKERVQFGRPIGSFQAIQHKVADMTTDLETARLLVRFAATRLDQGHGTAEAAYAKLWTSEAVQRVVREAHQIHGGVGFIIEHPLHRYFRRAKTGELMWGAPEELIDTLAEQLLDTTEGEPAWASL
jgi:alkylation response protein AidB-like acyl-CoA dehydrogenase